MAPKKRNFTGLQFVWVCFVFTLSLFFVNANRNVPAAVTKDALVAFLVVPRKLKFFFAEYVLKLKCLSI